MRRTSISPLKAAGILFLFLPFASYAADRMIAFHSVSGPDVPLVQQIMASDPQLNDLVARDYIRISQDVQIAKADLDDSGTSQILLFVKHNGDKPCTENPCEFQVWKPSAGGSWKKVGSYEMKQENLHMYDEMDNGYHEIANSQGIIPWNE